MSRVGRGFDAAKLIDHLFQSLAEIRCPRFF